MDYKTLFSVLVSVFLIQAIALTLTWRQNREEIGIRDWAVAAMLMSIGSLCSVIGLFMHTPADSPLSLQLSALLRAVGGSIGTAGWILVWMGVRRFYRKPTTGYGPVVLFVALFTLLLLQTPTFLLPNEWRVLWVSAAIAIFSALTLYTFFQRPLLRNPTVLLIITMLLFTSVVWLLRGLATLDHAAYVGQYAFLDSLALYDGIVASVTLTVSMIVLTNERINQRLRDQATKDPLTGIMNRRALFESSAPLLAMVQRETASLAVCVLDIDHFKKINDSHGHTIGDQVLKQFAKITQSTLREGDLCARYGGEEFVILLHNSSRTQAEQAGRRLRDAVADQGVNAGQQRLDITFSAGISYASGPAAVTLEKLLEAADRAMYRAKAAGRDRIVVCPDSIGARELEAVGCA